MPRTLSISALQEPRKSLLSEKLGEAGRLAVLRHRNDPTRYPPSPRTVRQAVRQGFANVRCSVGPCEADPEDVLIAPLIQQRAKEETQRELERLKEWRSRLRFNMDAAVDQHSVVELLRNNPELMKQLPSGFDLERFAAQATFSERVWSEMYSDYLPPQGEADDDYGDEVYPASGLRVIPAAAIVEQEVKWLWRNRFAFGSVSQIQGPMDVGKTWIVLYMMAHLTTGRDWPDGASNPFGGEPCSAVMLSAEDSAAQTLVPRLRMLGADLNRVKVCPQPDSLDLSVNIAQLESYLRVNPDVRYVAIDPITAFLGKTRVNDNDLLRSNVLTPLSNLCARYSVAVVLLNHMNKDHKNSDPKTRGIGATALSAATRSTYQVAEDPSDRDRRIFSEVKNNLKSSKVPALAFHFEEDRGLVWEDGEIWKTSEEILRESSGPGAARDAKNAEVEDWLLKELLRHGGQMLSDDLFGRARDQGFTEYRLKQAKQRLGIQAEKGKGGDLRWYWVLPAEARPS